VAKTPADISAYDEQFTLAFNSATKALNDAAERLANQVAAKRLCSLKGFLDDCGISFSISMMNEAFIERPVAMFHWEEEQFPLIDQFVSKLLVTIRLKGIKNGDNVRPIKKDALILRRYQGVLIGGGSPTSSPPMSARRA